MFSLLTGERKNGKTFIQFPAGKDHVGADEGQLLKLLLDSMCTWKRRRAGLRQASKWKPNSRP